MRTYKSIEQPSQVLGIDINNLFIVMGFIVLGGIFTGLIGMAVEIHWIVYVLLLLITAGLFFMFKYLAKHRPPGFAMGFVSYHLRQPKRLTIGLPSATHRAAKAKLAASIRKPAPKAAPKAVAKPAPKAAVKAAGKLGKALK